MSKKDKIFLKVEEYLANIDCRHSIASDSVFFIDEKRSMYKGLYIFVKNEYEDIYLRRDGKMRDDEEVKEQENEISNIRKKGYWAEFGLGLQDSIEKIDFYLGGRI